MSRNGRHGRMRGRSRAAMPRSRTSPAVMIRLPDATASSCMTRLLAKLASPTWAMLRPGRPSSISARTGLPLLRPASSVAHVEMGVERDQPDALESPPMPSSPGRVTALLPPTSSVSACALALAATASRIGGVASSMLSPARSISPRSQTARPRPARSRYRSGRSGEAFRAAAPAQGRSAPESPNPPQAARRPGRPARRDSRSKPARQCSAIRSSL